MKPTDYDYILKESACVVCHLLRQSNNEYAWLLAPPLSRLRLYLKDCIVFVDRARTLFDSEIWPDRSLVNKPSTHTMRSCALLCSCEFKESLSSNTTPIDAGLILRTEFHESGKVGELWGPANSVSVFPAVIYLFLRRVLHKPYITAWYLPTTKLVLGSSATTYQKAKTFSWLWCA